MLSTLRTPAYVVRGAVHTPQLMIQTKAAIRRAFELQMENRCFTFVEVLSNCPTNWGMTPAKSIEWLQKNQRESGRWWTRSLNTDSWHFITYSGTAYPLLALQNAEATSNDRPASP